METCTVIKQMNRIERNNNKQYQSNKEISFKSGVLGLKLICVLQRVQSTLQNLLENNILISYNIHSSTNRESSKFKHQK